MATEEELTARLAALDKAIHSGVLTVKHGDTLTTFRSMTEMMDARALLNAQIAAAAETPRSRVRYLYQAGKGL